MTLMMLPDSIETQKYNQREFHHDATNVGIKNS